VKDKAAAANSKRATGFDWWFTIACKLVELRKPAQQFYRVSNVVLAVRVSESAITAYQSLSCATQYHHCVFVLSWHKGSSLDWATFSIGPFPKLAG
jgi:hypothetical protein